MLSSFGQLLAAMPTDSVPSAYREVHFGLEQEVLPYMLRGWSLGGWVGLGKGRLRLASVRVDMPAFMRSRYLDREQIIANSACLDVFFREDYSGFYFGGGGGYWRTTLTPKNEFGSQRKEFHSLMFSGGCGYNIFIWKGLYCTPWVALHTRITGNTDINLGSAIYKPQGLLPEIAFKIGWHFGRGR